MGNQILVLRDLDHKYIDLIHDIAPEYEIITQLFEIDSDKLDIVLGWDEELANMIRESKVNIQWIQMYSAGVDFLPLKLFSDKEITLTSAKGIHANGITESIFAMLLSYYRGIIHSTKRQLEKDWDKDIELKEAGQKAIVIVGTGNIGKQTAKVAKTFDMETIGVNRSGNKVEYIDKLYTQEQLATAVSKGDVVVNILPSTDETNQIFNSDIFHHFKKDAVFINVGRGSTVATDDLIQALDTERISFAALDVFEKEPLPENHKLWNRNDVLITPHFAGYLDDYEKSVFELFKKNLQAYVKGTSLPINVIDYEKGY